ncbi:MAG: hypothetical protein IKH19_06845 [Muribaculaceae bacterium]|nr:hypothetical protein [Muribaculaceae bacterium]
MGGHELLYGIAQAFGFKGRNLDHSTYYDLGNGLQLRVGDHYGSPNEHKERGRIGDNYGFVIKINNSKFRDNPQVDYLEFVHYPDKITDARKQLDILDGLKTFVQTGDITEMTIPDRLNVSGKWKQIIPKELIDEINNGLYGSETAENGEYSLKEEDKKLGQGFGSAATSIKQTAGTIKRKINWVPGTVNVDIGGGRYDEATNFLKEKGVENLVFDPFNRNPEHNRAVAERVRDEKVDTVTCTNVLNVIDSEQSRANVILQAAKALKEGGTAYFSVYEGNKSGVGRQSQSDSWQNNRRTKDYIPEIEKYFEDVSLKNGVITAQNPKPTDELSVWDFDGRYEGNDVQFSLKEEHRKRSFEDMESGKVPMNGKLNPEETDGKFKSDTHQAAVRLTWDNKKKAGC